MVDVELDYSEINAQGLTEHSDEPSVETDQMPNPQKQSVKRRRRKRITMPPYKSSSKKQLTVSRTKVISISGERCQEISNLKSTNKTKRNSGDRSHSSSISGQQEHTNSGNVEHENFRKRSIESDNGVHVSILANHHGDTVSDKSEYLTESKFKRRSEISTKQHEQMTDTKPKGHSSLVRLTKRQIGSSKSNKATLDGIEIESSKINKTKSTVKSHQSRKRSLGRLDVDSPQEEIEGPVLIDIPDMSTSEHDRTLMNESHIPVSAKRKRKGIDKSSTVISKHQSSNLEEQAFSIGKTRRRHSSSNNGFQKQPEQSDDNDQPKIPSGGSSIKEEVQGNCFSSELVLFISLLSDDCINVNLCVFSFTFCIMFRGIDCIFRQVIFVHP